MCDESMHAHRSKRAVTGDKLATHIFKEAHGGVAGIKGAQTDTAICLLPGAKLEISCVPADLRKKHNLAPSFDAIFAERTNEFDHYDVSRSCIIGKNNFGLPVMFKIRELGEGAMMKVVAMVEEPAPQFCNLNLDMFNEAPPSDLFADFDDSDKKMQGHKMPELAAGDD